MDATDSYYERIAGCIMQLRRLAGIRTNRELSRAAGIKRSKMEQIAAGRRIWLDDFVRIVRACDATASGEGGAPPNYMRAREEVLRAALYAMLPAPNAARASRERRYQPRIDPRQLPLPSERKED